MCHYVYVDNLGILSLSEACVQESLAGVTRELDSVGLKIHEHATSSSEINVLGCQLDGTRLQTRVSPKRWWRVFQALTSVLRTQRISGRALEVLLGHMTFVALTNRRLLSILTPAINSVRNIIWR